MTDFRASLESEYAAESKKREPDPKETATVLRPLIG
jgi:hypothetical protein